MFVSKRRKVDKSLANDQRLARKRRAFRPAVEQLESRILLTASNQLFVDSVYHDLLRRPGEPSGLAFWTDLLERGESREQVAFSMASATEYRMNTVNFLYRDLLKRPTDSGGFDHFLTLLNSGGTDEQARAEVLGSTEYFQTRAGQSAAGFVTAIYEDIFIRDADPAERASYTDQVGHGVARTVIAAELFASKEYRQNVAEGFYEQFLFRTGETDGLAFWGSHLERGDTTEQVLSSFPGGPEYNSQTEHRQPLLAGAPLAVPGSTGQTVTSTFTLVGGTAGMPDELGLFQVDSQGRIGTLPPGSPGYAEAAISGPSSRILFTQGEAQGAVQKVILPAGGFLGLYLVQHKTSARLHNAADELGLMPTVYFSLRQANPDLFDHVQLRPNNQFAFEDLTGGGDRDFNDEVVQVDFAPVPGGDSTPPAIQAALTHDTGSSTADGVTFDPVLAGTVLDSGTIASFHAGFDSAAPAGFFNVLADLQGDGHFTLARARLDQINGAPLADGRHTLHLQAQDAAGNTSTVFDLTFTLDTQAPLVAVTSPAPNLVTTLNVTVAGQVADQLSGVDGLKAQVDAEPFSSVSFDASGSFTFTTNLPLDGSADGPHTIHLRATDSAGNTSGSSDLPFTLEACDPTTDFTDWTVQQVGGSSAGKGSVDLPDCAGATLHEGDSFNVTLRKTLTVPQQVSDLLFNFDAPAFDTTSQGTIKDAFEVAFVDAKGRSLLQTIGSGQDAFFNLSEGQPAALAAGVTLQGSTVTVSLAGLPAGSTGTLTFRLVNNDQDRTTAVHLNTLRLQASNNTAPPLSSHTTPSRATVPPIDFASLSDVSSSFTVNYGQTTFDDAGTGLFADLSVKNTGTYPVDSPLLIVIQHLSDPSVLVVDADGTTPDGAPFFDFSTLVAGPSLSPGGESQARTLEFLDPKHMRFAFDVQVLGQLNHPPVFSSQPNTEAIPGVAYVYQAKATDADMDALAYTLLSGPAGMTVDRVSGKVAWGPTSSDLGNQAVLLQVDDGHGGTAQQQYTVSTIAAPPNRPPVFTSTPPVDGNVNTGYVYQPSAGDLDGDPLTFSVVAGPQGLVIDPATGTVTWTPAATELGTNSVTLQASDGRGGTATQAYAVGVLQQAGNHAPAIISQPVTAFSTASVVGSMGGGSIFITGHDPIWHAHFGTDTHAARDIARTMIDYVRHGSTLPFLFVESNNPLEGTFLTPNLGYAASDYVVAGISVLAGFSNFRAELNHYSAVVVASDDGGMLTAAELAFLDNHSGDLIDYINAGGGLAASAESNAQGAIGNTPRFQFLPFIVSSVDFQAFETSNAVTPFGASLGLTDADVNGNFSHNFFSSTGGMTAVDLFNGDSARPLSLAFRGRVNTEGVILGTYGYGVQAIDPETDPLRYSLTIKPTGMSIDPTTGIIAWPIHPQDLGSHPITVRVDDGRGGFDTQSYTLLVSQNQLGVIEGTVFNDQNANGSGVVYLDQNHNGNRDPGEPTTTTDIEGKYSFTNVTPDSYVVALEGQQGFSQTRPSAGAYAITVDAGQDVSGLDFGTTAVTSGERGPKFTSTPPATVFSGQVYHYDATVSNPDGRPLTFDLSVAPAGMAVDATTGVLVWAPTIAQFGQQRVLFRVRDDRGNVDIQNVTITVGLPDHAPVITSTAPTSAVAGSPYDYQVRAQDADGDLLTYQLTASPTGMVVDPSTGLLTWTPTLAQLGGQIVTIAVSDGRGAVATQSFNLTVLATAGTEQPLITSSPRTTIGLGSNYRYQVEVSDPNSDPLTFSLPTVPDGMTVDATGLISWRPAAGQFGLNSVSVRVADGRGGVATQDFKITVTHQTSNRSPSIVSTPSPAARAGLLYQYDARATDPDGDPVVWSLDTAPAGMSLDSRLGSVRWTPTLDQLGSQLVVLRATDAQGGLTRQSFNVRVRSVNTPPTILSSPTTQSAVGRLYSYPVEAVDADGDSLIYSLVTAPAGMTIDAATGEVQWAPAAGQLGPQGIILNVTDNRSGGVLQVYTVVVSSTGANEPPRFTSTPPLVATVGQPYAYQPTASDPEGDALHFSLSAAPAGMTIDGTSGNVQWTPAASQLGANSVLLLVVDSVGNVATQRFTLVALAVNHPPTIASNPVITATAGESYHYDVRAGDPDADPIHYALPTAPAGMSIDPLGRITWSPQISDIGSRQVQVTATDDRGATASQSYTVIVSADTEAPQVSLFLSTNPLDLGAEATVVVSATDNVAVSSLGLTENGVAIALDATGSAIIHGSSAGTFTLAATARDAAGNVGTDSQALVVRDPKVTGAPTVDLTTPDDNATITSPTDIIGTVEDPNLVSYTLAVAPLGSDSFTNFFTATTQVSHGLLGHFDPTLLQNDSYVVRLTAVNTGGLRSTTEITVHVAQSLKLGNFALSFTDLTVPVSGIPISVTRTYDSLNVSESGDFGFGWRLEFRNVDLRTSVTPTGMEHDGIYHPFEVGSRVYVTLPGGVRQGFTFQPRVAAGLRGSFLGIFEPRFVPDAGVLSSLTVSPADLRIDTSGNVFDFETGVPFNPTSSLFGGSYLLTTTDGLAYDIDGQTGQLTAVSDSTNNTLTFSDAGIVSSTGTSVTFQRDPQGRIAAVVDPMGKRVQYQYDVNGDLVSVTDRTNDTTQFVYRSSPAHFLDKVIDPLGHTGTRTDFDAQGRLTQIIDAAGNPVQITYDPTHSLETVKDQFGSPTIYEYDARGNIVMQTGALGGVTRRTYDASNDLLTETDPLGRTSSFTYDDRGDVLTRTDPLGNVSISTYAIFTFGTTALAASRGEASAPYTRLETRTDALGNTTAFGVSFLGSYVSSTDPEGHTTSIPVNDSGNPISVTDANGNTAQFEYDDAGHVVRETDTLGHATEFTYDANGKQLTSTTTVTAADGTVHTLTSRTAYDGQGRTIAVTDAMGGVTRTEYDAAGNRTATVDALGRRTEYVYDDLNRLIETIFPDATPGDQSDNPRTRSEYDAAGRQSASIDESGRQTAYLYDLLGRLVQTTNPDGTFAQTEYDADGEKTAQIDARGNRTEFQYDAAGRQILERDALGNATVTTYDVVGRITAATDALGQTTAFVRDAVGRLVETDYSDGSKTTTAYDGRGQVTARTDQLGQTTRYQYDAAGRPTAVVDALGNTTTSTYDERGNQLTSTSALTAADGTVRLLTTRTAYDDLGRVSTDTDAEGGVTRSEYDASGNRTATIDPLGRRTEYRYDERSRLVETVYPDDTPADHSDNPRTRTEFDAAGRAIGSIDELGRRTESQYDTVGRLVKTTYADGTFTQTEHNADGEVTAQIDERGDRTEFQYDADGRQSLLRDALGNSTSCTYDAVGRRISETDALGHTTHFVFDALGRLIETDFADGTKTTSSYDKRGQVVASTDQLDRITHYEHDALGRVTAVVDPLNQRTEYAYDEAGDVMSRKDANGHVALYRYDGLRRRTATVLPALAGQPPFGSTTQYDADGNVVRTVDFNGNTILFAYDARNQLVAKDYPDGTSFQFTYTLTGQEATVTDGRGTTRYVFDVRDRLVSCTEPDATVIAYQYDPSGNRTAITTPAGTVGYTFDALSRPATVTDSDGGVTTFVYDAAGNLTKTQMSNGTVENRAYDTLNRLVFLEDMGPAGVISSYRYTLASTGRRDAVVEDTGRRVDYGYDALDRLTQEKITDAVFGNRTMDYTCDPVGNRLTRNDSDPGVGLAIYSYDANDRLVVETDAGVVAQYSYDKNGNMLSRVSATDKVFYTWDLDNRLIAADTNGDGTIDERNVYDSAGNRVSQTAAGKETRFLIDTVQSYPQVVLEYVPGGLVTASYVYGNRLISQARGGVRSFYHVDGLGSTRVLTTGTGAVSDHYVYDAFGQMLAQSGSTANTYLFAGQQRDLVLGLDYLRARFYTPSQGRFTAADPLRGALTDAGSFQFYVYGDNNPVNRTDPTGKSSIVDVTISLAVLNALFSATSAYFRGGRSISAGINGFFQGFATALLGGIAFGGLAGTLARSLGSVVATSFSVTLGVGLGADALYSANNAAHSAQTDDQAIAAGIDFLSIFVNSVLGVRLTSDSIGRATAAPGDSPGILRALTLESELTGVPVAKTSPGPIESANLEVGPDPLSGKKLFIYHPFLEETSFLNEEYNGYRELASRVGPDDTLCIVTDVADNALVTGRDVDPQGNHPQLRNRYFGHVKDVVFISKFKGEYSVDAPTNY